MSYYMCYDRYSATAWFDDAPGVEPLETHTDADLDLPDGAVAAIDAAAQPEFDEPPAPPPDEPLPF